MAEISAGLLMYRTRSRELEVFLVHPGGPFFAEKDAGVWSIPKGLQHDEEKLFTTARREFMEETGIKVAQNTKFIDLGSITYTNGKLVYCWAFENHLADPVGVRSNTFAMVWPPKSGKLEEFPEIDRGEFFCLEKAYQKIKPAQKEFLSRLATILGNF